MYSGSLKMDANQSFSNSISLSDRINTTIKDQVEQFESSIDNLRRTMEGQRKQHNDLFLSLKKLQELNTSQYKKIGDCIDLGLDGLSLKMERECHSEDKQLCYLELQNKMLIDEQKQLEDVVTMETTRVNNLSQSVGL